MIFFNPPPADDVELFRVSVHPETGDRQYCAVPFITVAGRIKRALAEQDFSAVYYLLIRTSGPPQTRYYPLPLVLNNAVDVPSYAQDATARLHAALAQTFDTPLIY